MENESQRKYDLYAKLQPLEKRIDELQAGQPEHEQQKIKERANHLMRTIPGIDRPRAEQQAREERKIFLSHRKK